MFWPLGDESNLCQLPKSRILNPDQEIKIDANLGNRTDTTYTHKSGVQLWVHLPETPMSLSKCDIPTGLPTGRRPTKPTRVCLVTGAPAGESR